MKIEFGNLEIGKKFFDEYSGDYWVKISEDTASDVSDGVDNFGLDEIVIVED
jgi:hypothetical protein